MKHLEINRIPIIRMDIYEIPIIRNDEQVFQEYFALIIPFLFKIIFNPLL